MPMFFVCQHKSVGFLCRWKYWDVFFENQTKNITAKYLLHRNILQSDRFSYYFHLCCVKIFIVASFIHVCLCISHASEYDRPNPCSLIWKIKDTMVGLPQRRPTTFRRTGEMSRWRRLSMRRYKQRNYIQQ